LPVRLDCLVLIISCSSGVVAVITLAINIAFIVGRIFVVVIFGIGTAFVVFVSFFIVSDVFVVFAIAFNADDFFLRICWWCFSVVL
jgi:hypothetical protein